MMRITSFHPQHLALLDIQSAQNLEMLHLTREALDAAAADTSFTLWVGERPIGCGGVLSVWYGRAFAWAFVAADAGPRLISATRFVRMVLDQHPARRIEATVDASFSEGRRWAEMLGFHVESRKRLYFPNGADAIEYVRLR